MSVCMTKKELASVAGYTYRRLYDIDRALPENKKLFVSDEDGKYDLGLFVQRWVEYNVSHEMEDVDDLDTVKARHEVVKTQKTELEVARMRGQLIDVQDVRKLWGDIANTVMQNLIQMPNRVSPLLQMQSSSDVIAGILDEEIRRVLENIAQTPVPDYAEIPEEGKDEDGESEQEGAD